MTRQQAINAIHRGEHSPVYRLSDEYRAALAWLNDHPMTTRVRRGWHLWRRHRE